MQTISIHYQLFYATAVKWCRKTIDNVLYKISNISATYYYEHIQWYIINHVKIWPKQRLRSTIPIGNGQDGRVLKIQACHKGFLREYNWSSAIRARKRKQKKKEFARMDFERKREKGARRWLRSLWNRTEGVKGRRFSFLIIFFFSETGPRGRSGGMCRRYPGLVRPCQIVSQSRRRTSDNRKPTVPPRRESRRYPGDKHRSTR